MCTNLCPANEGELMKILILTILLILVSCDQRNSSGKRSNKTIFGINGNLTVDNMINEGVYFTVRSQSGFKWIELRCANRTGKTNDHKARVLMEVINKTPRLTFGNKVLQSWEVERMANEALWLLDMQPQSTRCPDLILAVE